MADIDYDWFVEHKVKSGETLEGIAEKNGLTWQQLALFNYGTDVPVEVNRCLHEYTGCTKQTADGKNYVFSDGDVPGILYVPKPVKPLALPTGKKHQVRVKRRIMYSRVELQTVDELGFRSGNVDLILRSLEGLPDVALHVGASGYGKLDKVRAGKYRVLLGGKPVYIFPAGQPVTDDDTPLVEAVIDTRNHTRAITRVVVSLDATEKERDDRHLLKKVYRRPGATSALDGRGEETSGETRRSNYYAIDNLALAAGWTSDYSDLNAKILAETVLHGFLRDYHPTAISRGYHVLLLQPTARTLVLVSSAGQVEKKFALADGVQTRGLFGAYALFENIEGNTFVDLTTMSAIIALPGNNDGLEIDQIVDDGPGLVQALNKHAGEVEIVYYAPTARQLALLGLLGGTGRLEDYGHDGDVNRSVHGRNLAVCHSIKLAYDGYVQQYVQKVQKTASEDELRKLGPPRPPYEMPTPAGATDRQMDDIFDALNTNEFDAWLAIAHQLDHFANRLSQGYPFLRIKPKFVATPKVVNKIKNFLRPGLPDISEKTPAEVEFEMNIDIQYLGDGQYQVITKGDALIKGKVKLDSVVKKVTKTGVPVEISFKQSLGNPEKKVTSVKIGKYQIEVDTLGKSKLSVEAVPGVWLDSELNAESGVFGSGVSLKGKDLAKAMKGKSEFLDRWAGYIEGFELQVQIGLVGTREETILAVTSNAPGFFERRSLKELFSPDTQWDDLTLDEQQSLVALGWYGAVWDAKYHVQFKDKLPASLTKDRAALSDDEKVAIVHLGFYAYEDYKKQFTHSAKEFCDYAY